MNGQTKVKLGMVLLIAAMIAVSAIAVGADPLGADVTWNAGRPLTWSDFRGIPPETHTAEAAAIAMRISWHVAYTIVYSPAKQMWTATIGPADVTVTNTMDPRTSWVRHGDENPTLLDHEQRHFDLNEVYARVLARAISGLLATGTTRQGVDGKLRQLIASAGARILAALKVMQRGYDDQTGHGTHLAQQQAWDERIAVWLRTPAAAPATAVDARAVLSGKMAIGDR